MSRLGAKPKVRCAAYTRKSVTREAIADGYAACPVTSVPAADVEGAVLDHVQKLLAAPELVARTWAAAKREEDAITEREVTVRSPLRCSPPNKRASLCEPHPPVGDVGARYNGGDPRRVDESGTTAGRLERPLAVELGGAARPTLLVNQ